MVHQEIEHNGRLAIFKLTEHGQPVVTASGYLIPEENEVRLYLVSLWEVKRTPPRRLTHVALARFAKVLGATHLVPVDHAVKSVQGRVTAVDLAGGFIPTHAPVGLSHLEAKLARLAD
ncbi:hypothetical protein WJ96_07685 [Burkholderia ubonensis]|uniref:Uncharacterized protein n=1 Tax=Burkholderia ubonensis TaxID=101571 RepID=A0AAW3MYL6_9BURK|nr:hypothetical protein [Burkholderia ubonensis]KVP75581.1 hypothetical protein WJ93_09485 [Burkholderia ubonensis]KVP97043.1 hypothetical protein WJ97_14590 [Burkholderia ubonensis]KVP98393.1 hypothetical protein WJ96_07685 [Burkholderia ubonensis]KVZ93092.1 hypothetical protein WL25_19350 [Burkholderia ubonensis]